MHLSPMWFGNAWNQWKPASSCAALRAYARRDGLAFIGSERYWDHARAALCGGGMRHVVTLRSPVARARSMLQHLQRHNWRALRRHLRPTSEQLVAILAAAVTHNTSHQAGVATARAGGARRREWRPPPLAAALLRPGAAALAAASADWTWRNFPWASLPALLSEYSTRVLAGSALCAAEAEGRAAPRCHPFEMPAAEVRAVGGVQLAREMLEQYDAVLLLEEARRWPQLLAASLNWSQALAIPHLRASSARSEGGAAAADLDGGTALLAEHNQMDAEVYAYGRRIERVDFKLFFGRWSKPAGG